MLMCKTLTSILQKSYSRNLIERDLFIYLHPVCAFMCFTDTDGSVAQLDRVPDYGSGGFRFES